MDIRLSNGAEEVIALLESRGHKAYAVGGCVRDQIMGKEPFDFDITTDATADEMLSIFSSHRVLTTGIKHGTVAVFVGKDIFECTTFRVDGEYTDSRHPDSVTFSRNLCDDLSRRDFTVNALCYNKSDGLIDLFGGIDDIRTGTIRCIGEAEKRFTEDALRILRGLRFASTLGFTVDERTAKAMLSCAPLLKNISKERITEEFRKMLTGRSIGYVLENFAPVIKTVIPGFDVSDDAVEMLSSSVCDFEYRVSLLIKHNTDNEAILSALRLPKKVCESISQLTAMTAPENKIGIKKMLGSFKEENVLKYLTCSDDKAALQLYEEIKANGECYALSQLAVTGKDILSLGVESHKIGGILNRLLDDVINGKTENTKEELIKAIR